MRVSRCSAECEAHANPRADGRAPRRRVLAGREPDAGLRPPVLLPESRWRRGCEANRFTQFKVLNSYIVCRAIEPKQNSCLCREWQRCGLLGRLPRVRLPALDRRQAPREHRARLQWKGVTGSHPRTFKMHYQPIGKTGLVLFGCRTLV